MFVYWGVMVMIMNQIETHVMLPCEMYFHHDCISEQGLLYICFIYKPPPPPLCNEMKRTYGNDLQLAWLGEEDGRKNTDRRNNKYVGARHYTL